MHTRLNIFAIGAGGSGMSGLIRLLKRQGHHVSGSDQSKSAKVDALQQEGIHIFPEHNAAHITNDINEVIYSQAISENNPELQKARALQIPIRSYPEALGEYTSDTTRVCIAGTHGKTTTTAMVAACLIAGKRDPTVIVGADVKELDGKNERLGKSGISVLETCEYKKSFLSIPPNILIITNIDFDHIDYYKTKKNYDDAFVQYMNMVPKKGMILYMKDDLATKKLLMRVKGVTIKPVNVKEDLNLSVPGRHNLRNASLAYELARQFKVSDIVTRKALREFSGTKRRLEYKGSITTPTSNKPNHQTKVYDDYGHHPTEIKATLSALRELYPTEKILTIFQPHQFSRTKAFLKDFGMAFTNTNAVIISNIYEARDSKEDKESMPPEKLIAEIAKHHANVSYGESVPNTIEILKSTAKDYDVIVTMGAGDVNKIAEALV